MCVCVYACVCVCVRPHFLALIPSSTCPLTLRSSTPCPHPYALAPMSLLPFPCPYALALMLSPLCPLPHALMTAQCLSLSSHISTYLPTYLPTYLSACLSIYLSISLSHISCRSPSSFIPLSHNTYCSSLSHNVSVSRLTGRSVGLAGWTNGCMTACTSVVALTSEH
jgi:hypothetical protein